MRLSQFDLRGKIFLIVALLYITYTVFPLFADLVAIPVWAPSLISSALFFLLYPGAFKNKVLYWFIAYAAILFLYLLVGKPLTIGIGTVEDSKKIIIEFAFLLPTLCIFSIMNYLRNDTLNKYLIVTAFIILYLSFVVAYPLMLRYHSIREALSESEMSGANSEILGLPGYSLMHAYTLLVPAICCWVKVSTSAREKLISLIALIILCIMVYDTFVTTSLIIMIGVLLFSILYKDNNNAVTWLVIFAGLFLVIWKSGLFVSVIDWAMPMFEGTPVEPKLLDFKVEAMGLNSENGTIDGRMNLHAISINSFFENPIWGTSIVGGHSTLMDRFGGLGLLCGIPFLMIIISFVRIMKCEYETKICKIFFYVAIVCSFIYLYEKGLWGCESWLAMMVLVPYLIQYLEKSHFEKDPVA